MGVDCFKTDFGRRIPTDVQWFDGSDPQKMHNHYAFIYNELVWKVLKETVGEQEAVLFAAPPRWARSSSRCTGAATAITTNRWRKLSLTGCRSASPSASVSGVTISAVRKHRATAHVYKRWCAFGLLSSHSPAARRQIYRVPWALR